MKQDTKINKARHNSIKTTKDYLLLTIEGHLKQIGKEIDGVFTPYTFIIKKQEYSFDTCLDSEKSDNFANLLIKVYNLLRSSKYKINDKLEDYEKLFFCKVMEYYDFHGTYSEILKKDVQNLYCNFYNLFKKQMFTDITTIELPSAEALISRILELKQINDTHFEFDTVESDQ